MFSLHDSYYSLIFTRTRKLILLQQKSRANPGNRNFSGRHQHKQEQLRNQTGRDGSLQVASEQSGHAALPE